MRPLLLHHFSRTQRESSRTHLRTTSDSVIGVRTMFRNLSMHFGIIPLHFICSRTHRNPEDTIHMFAGRVYDEPPLPESSIDAVH